MTHFEVGNCFERAINAQLYHRKWSSWLFIPAAVETETCFSTNSFDIYLATKSNEHSMLHTMISDQVLREIKNTILKILVMIVELL